jgi:hypothetical protein
MEVTMALLSVFVPTVIFPSLLFMIVLLWSRWSTKISNKSPSDKMTADLVETITIPAAPNNDVASTNGHVAVLELLEGQCVNK